jgi:hypothetical protein
MGIWVIALVAAVASLMYQKFDGPTIQSVTAANLSLEHQNVDLNGQLSGSQSEVASLQSQLVSLQHLLSRSSAELNATRSRAGTAEKEGGRFKRMVERFVTVVPLELPPYDVKLTP